MKQFNQDVERSRKYIYQKRFGWTYVGPEMAEKHNTANESFVRKMKRRARCKCPQSKAWYCDQCCNGCMYFNMNNDIPADEDLNAEDRLRNIITETSIDAEINEADDDTASFIDNLPSEEDTPDRVYEKKEISAALVHALDTLKSDEKELIVMLFIEQLTDIDAAAKLGLSRMTVYRRKMNILGKLKNILKDFF